MKDEELVPISALQHYSFCPRQCGLIHLEQSFEENALTLRGQAVHRRVELADSVLREGTQVEYSLSLSSKELGIYGQADVVEFSTDGTPFPLEFKHGVRAERIPDAIQLVAQALCLEEMTGKPVTAGAIYYHSSRRRREVQISEDLKQLTKRTIQETRAMLLSMKLPPPVNDNRCRNCSLIEICQPSIIAEKCKKKDIAKLLFGGDKK